MENSPLVSVIVPAYNAEQFITRTLDSVLNQTYRNLEVLVVDDGSKDRTAEIVEEIAIKDSRVSLLRQQNSGVAKARNLAIVNARGEYIAPVDADDIWYPEKIEKQIEVFLNSEPSVGLVYAWSVFIDESDRVTNRSNAIDSFHFSNIASVEGEVYLPLIYRNFIGNSSVPLIRKSCLNKVGNYNELLKEQDAQGCEDWDLQLRIAEFYQYKVVPNFLVGYRRYSNSMSGNHLRMAKSYNLIMADVKEKYSQIPKLVYSWSKSYFFSSLFAKSHQNEQHLVTIYLLKEAAKADYKILIKPGVYKIFILTLIKYILPKKIASKIDIIRYSFKRKNVPEEIEVSYLEKLESVIKYSSDNFSPYKCLVKKRWYKILKLNQLKIWRSRSPSSSFNINNR